MHRSIVGVLFVVDTTHSIVYVNFCSIHKTDHISHFINLPQSCLRGLEYVVGNFLIVNSPFDLVATSLTAASHSVVNYGNPASLEGMCVCTHQIADSLSLTQSFSSNIDVGWIIPFTAVATSVAAVLTQSFVGHR